MEVTGKFFLLNFGADCREATVFTQHGWEDPQAAFKPLLYSYSLFVLRVKPLSPGGGFTSRSEDKRH